MTLPLLTPADVGLPRKFTTFRSYSGFDQFATAHRLAKNPAGVRTSALYAPPGAGKSATYMTAHLLASAGRTDFRTLILVGTKGLQTQLLDDFAPIGLARVWGHRNYPCAVQVPGVSVDDPEYECLSPARCQHKRDIEAAQKSRLVVCNYAYWMTIAKYGHPDLLGEFDLLVLDEVHTAPEWLTDFVAVDIHRRAVREMLGCDLPVIDGAEVGRWGEWAASTLTAAREKYRTVKTRRLQVFGMDLARFVNRQKAGVGSSTEQAVGLWLAGKREIPAVHGLRRTSTIDIPPLPRRPYSWIGTDLPNHSGVRFTPIWGAQYAEQYLLRDIDRVIACSGTLSPAVLTRLGIGPESAEYVEVPSPFPAERRPVIYVPTVRIQHDMTEAQKMAAVRRLDSYIDSRLAIGRGIIHTRSYAWAAEIISRSRHTAVMIPHRNSAQLPDAIRRFLSTPSSILVSPSVEEGYNFPDDDCRWQVIWKCLVGDSRDPLHKARIAADHDYRYAQTTESILQIAGRIVRSEMDWGETVIFDDHWQHVRKQYFPEWFRQAWRWCEEIPPAIQF